MRLKGKTSLNTMVERIELLYENVYNLLVAFQKASVNEKNTSVEVTLKNPDGTSKTVKVNSFHQIQQELSRLQNNFNTLTNENNISYILNGDGTISQFTRTTFMNAPYLDTTQLSMSDTCVVDMDTVINDLVYPLVKIPVIIDRSFVQSNIKCKSFNVTQGFEQIPDGVTYIQLKNLINNGTIVADMEVERTLTPTKEQVKFFGKFNVEDVERTNDSDIFRVTLNDVHYTGMYVNGSTIELKINDVLVSDTGASKWLIQDISIFNNLVVLKRIAGNEPLSTGINKLFFNQAVDIENFTVGIPVKPAQNLVVFLSTESPVAVSYPSNGIKLSTADYKVSYNNNTYTIDEFYSTYVTNLSDYLQSIIDENTIPYSLGIKPKTPELLASNFKVVQINKHLTNAKSIQDINELNQKKQSIQNEISAKQAQIDEIKSNIRSNHYTSDFERRRKQDEIINIQNEIDSLNNNLLSISRRIETNATQNSLKTSKAKYKVVGFWPVQQDIYSSSTGAQHIIHYDIQYRYLNQNADEINNTTLKMLDNGNEVSVVFSAWNNYDSTTLSKVKNLDGSSSWEEPSVSDVDDISINQCMITINENESVEIRVRAVSEAGYPISPMKSDWSNIIRVNFPEDLRQNNVNSIVEQNEIDMRKSELVSIMKTYGLIDHINTQVIEQDRTFVHEAKQITSGMFTDEMKNIPLDEALKGLVSRIKILEDSYITKPLTISVIDFNNEEFELQNNQALEIYAGPLNQEFDPYSRDDYGRIVRKKCYIKIKNPNNISVDIKSLQPKGSSYLEDTYAVVPVAKNSSDNSFKQELGQIIYFRDTDLTLSPNFPLYVKYLPESFRTPTNGRIISTSTGASNRVSSLNQENIYYLDEEGTIQKAYIDSDIVDVPGIIISAPDNMITVEYLRRIQSYVSIFKSEKQVRITDGVYPFKQLGFNDYDRYAVGRNTCGAFFYPVFGNIERFKVRGDSSTSTLVMSANQELMIPMIFEYRMFDALGRLNGETINMNESLTYKKTLGVSMNISNQPFTFDITAFVKL